MSDPTSNSKPVLIVGAGMAGLACALTLHRSGVPFLLFDRDKKVGGRVQTDEVDGYRLDRGFQVLLTAYQESKRFLDYEKLELKSCYPGSRVWYKGNFIRYPIHSGIHLMESVRFSIRSVLFLIS